MIRILLVEDEAAIRLALSRLLGKEGYEVTAVGTAREAFEELTRPVDLVLTDLALGKTESGLDVLAESQRLRPEVPVILITAHGNERVAVEAMKAGAEDYVPKPFDNEEIRRVVRRGLERTRLERELSLLRERLDREYGFGALIGSGRPMHEVFDTIKKVAETDLTCLVRGESGSGKELVAQALHERSSRRNQPFIAVNCAAISRELVESELFGHEKGAFTGADAQRSGRFEAAEGGTIFLDEIGDMPLETQAKVLRVLQERSFERVGGGESIKADVRVIAATHRDLESEVEEGNFRQDLYYRLAVVPIHLPPLRERIEDIPLLVERFASLLAERLEREKKVFSPEALTRLAAHSWPGNVRELRNVVEQTIVLSGDGEVSADEVRLPKNASKTDEPWSDDASFADAKRAATRDFERRYLRAALSKHDGNVSRAAEAVGLARQSLQQKLKELGLDADEFRRQR